MSSNSIQVTRTCRPFGLLVRQLRRLRRREDGATVIEFAAVIGPFLAIMFAIIEVGLTFFAGQALETAVADSARLIMTGQVQKQGLDAAAFKQDLCSRLLALINCADGVQVDVKKYGSFDGVNLSPPAYDPEEGKLDTSDFGYQPGAQGEIVVVRVVYEWPTFLRGFGFDLATLPNGKRLLMATAAFRNEPFGN